MRLPSVAAWRHFGFLSAFFNSAIAAFVALLLLAASAETSPLKRYRIENTLWPASKRPLMLLDARGQPFAKRGDCVAAPATLTELPRHLLDAAAAMEDRRFYSHPGVDPLGILRAARRNYTADRTREGGSTITQQLVKISYLSSSRTIERKIEEALLATWLEMRLKLHD